MGRTVSQHAAAGGCFLEFVRPRTLLGKIQHLRQVPFNISIASQTTGGTYGWVGQNKPKPVTKADFATVTLGIAKASGIIVVTEELTELSRPGAERLLRTELAAGLSQFTDTQFVDPTVAPVTDVSLGSILNGTTPIASAGGTAANALTDIKALIAAFTAANPDVEFAVFLMSPANAVGLAVATGLPGLGLDGGVLFGVPIVTSTALGTKRRARGCGRYLIRGRRAPEHQRQPECDGATGQRAYGSHRSGDRFRSLFQFNLVGLRVDRLINWKRGRLSAAKYVSGATYV